MSCPRISGGRLRGPLQESIGVTPECEISCEGRHASITGQQVRPGKQKKEGGFAVTVKISAKAAKNFERR
jgi:hypothetical protein